MATFLDDDPGLPLPPERLADALQAAASQVRACRGVPESKQK